MISRRHLFVAAGVLMLATPACSASRPSLTVYKTASCGCCGGWVEAMSKVGYAPSVIVVEDITPLGDKHGVPFALSSCHLATVGGYVTVGHVPPADVDRLLREKPKALGLTVPGMPIGSPGMESPDGRIQPYTVELIGLDGGTSAYANHGP